MKRFKPGDPVKLEIELQGKPNVNRAIIRKFSREIAVVDIDMVSKHCKVHGYWAGEDIGVYIDKTDDSTCLLEREHDFTAVRLPEFDGWDIVGKWDAGYTITLCLVKNEIH